jgi:hypothetical protein
VCVCVCVRKCVRVCVINLSTMVPAHQRQQGRSCQKRPNCKSKET